MRSQYPTEPGIANTLNDVEVAYPRIRTQAESGQATLSPTPRV